MNIASNSIFRPCTGAWTQLERGQPGRLGLRNGRADLAIQAILRGDWAMAESLLGEWLDAGGDDAFRLNVLGVCAERRGEVCRARELYGDAIRANRNYEPAQQNMRRMFELEQFGSSREPFAVGHPLVDLLLARGRLDAAHDALRKS